MESQGEDKMKKITVYIVVESSNNETNTGTEVL